MCWACATQPGLPPLRAQFHLGIPTDGSSSLFLGLGEFVWCDRVGFFNNKKFRLGVLVDGSSSLFLGLGFRGGPRRFWGQLVQARPGYASGSIISPIEPLNDADQNQVAVWGWSSSLF